MSGGADFKRETCFFKPLPLSNGQVMGDAFTQLPTAGPHGSFRPAVAVPAIMAIRATLKKRFFILVSPCPLVMRQPEAGRGLLAEWW